MAHALVALGSNLGDRAEQLNAALVELARLPSSRLIRRSGWFETPPIGGPAGQGAFLNGSALLWTALAPRQLLAELQRIEEQLGRVRGERWGARVIDLDLLLFDQLVIEHPDSSPGLRPGVDTRTTPLRSAARPPGGAGGCHEGDDSAIGDLIIPHPRMAFRRFVLEPAAAVAPWSITYRLSWCGATQPATEPPITPVPKNTILGVVLVMVMLRRRSFRTGIPGWAGRSSCSHAGRSGTGRDFPRCRVPARVCRLACRRSAGTRGRVSRSS